MLKAIFVLALAGSAHASSLDLVKPALESAAAKPVKRKALSCRNAASIRDFKAASVEDSGWDHKTGDELARCACPKQADAAGWPKPRPVLPEDWRGAMPSLSKDDHAGDVKRFAEEFLLFPKRPLPVTREQAYKISDCWITLQMAR